MSAGVDLSGFKRLIYQTFTKSHGLSLQADATQYLAEILSTIPEEETERSIEHILSAYQKLDVESNIVSKKTLEMVVDHIVQSSHSKTSDSQSSKQHFHIIDAFQVPKYKYHQDRKSFIKADASNPQLLGQAESRADMFRQRYELIRQRILRSDMFRARSSSWKMLTNPGESEKASYKLTPINALKGSTGNQLLFGMLSQIKEGRYFLEDLDSSVELDLSNAMTVSCFFTETCFVLAEGECKNGIFHVSVLGSPPPEEASVTKQIHGHIPFFGVSSDVDDVMTIEHIEKSHSDSMMIIISDVWLDQPKVVEKLRILFTGFAEMQPTAFIFCGNFHSEAFSWSRASTPAIERYIEGFSALGELIGQFPALIQHSQFIFIPGPGDPGSTPMLPRAGLPDFFVKKFLQKIPTAKFTSNPTRIQYCTQSLIFYREDLLTKVRRNAIRVADGSASASSLFPSSAGNKEDTFSSSSSPQQDRKKLLKMLLDQSHLSPLPLQVSPVAWEYDHALCMYPLPNVLFLADSKCEQYHTRYANTLCANPSSFTLNDFAFLVYYPATGDMEPSKIDV